MSIFFLSKPPTFGLPSRPRPRKPWHTRYIFLAPLHVCISVVVDRVKALRLCIHKPIEQRIVS